MQETMQSLEPFNLQRMFLGDHNDLLFFIEIAFRTVVMYSYTLFFARLVGKRAVGQISPFEFILVIAISSAAGDPMFYLNVPLLHGMVVMTVVILLHRAVGFATSRSEMIENIAESDPLLVVSEGNIVETAIGAGTISRKELLMNLRVQGVRNVGEVEKAYFEPSGQFSIFRAPQDQQKETESTQPKEIQSS